MGERADPARGHKLAMAKSYPFMPPPRSIIWCAAGEFIFDAPPLDPLGGSPVFRGPERAPASDALAMVGAHRSTPMSQRTPVIAYGANRSPERIAEKFDDLVGPQSVVPMLKAELSGFDVVFSAHISSYGAIPATLGYRPGVTVEVSVLYLDGPQLERLDASEAINVNYERRRFSDLSMQVDGLGDLPIADAYISLHGCFDAGDGRALALSAVPAVGRVLPSASGVEALNMARQQLDRDILLDDFIARLGNDEDYRARASAHIG
ncbi:MAG: gamma-glutamylcyclotransferase family protein, partial [Pseudomonadota bacterium]